MASLLILLLAGPASALSVYLPDGINAVNVIDTASQHLIAKIPVGDAPGDAAVTSDGRQVFVANTQSNSVSVIDTLSNTVISNIPLSGIINSGGGSIARIAISPDGKYCFFVTQRGFVALDVTNSVVNPAAAFVSSHTLFGFPQFFEADMAPDGQRLYIPTGIAALQYLLPRPPFTNTLMSLPSIPSVSNDNTAADNVAVSTDSKTIFVTNFADVKQVLITGPTTSALVSPTSYGFASTFDSTYGSIALAPSANRLFITQSGGTIEFLSLPLTGLIAQAILPIQNFFTSTGRWGLTPDGSTLYVGGKSFITVTGPTPTPNLSPLLASGVAAVVQPVTPTPGPPPSMISDLAATVSGSQVKLTWTAPSDGVVVGNTSAAVAYQIAFATFSLNINTFSGATFIPNPPQPLSAGTLQTFTLRGLPPTQTVYFEIKALGETAGGVQQFSLSNTTSVATPTSFAPGQIFTYAGTGSSGSSGDGGAATSAALNTPEGVSVDNDGNVYIADTGNCAVRKINVNGIINTVAGLLFSCSSGGDGGPALQAHLNAPKDVTADGFGNIFIADTQNNAVRKVNASGTITTIASLSLPQAVAVDPTGNVYVVNGSALVKISTSGASTTLATGSIQAVAADQVGNVYYSNGFQIFKIPLGGSAVLVAGTGASAYAGDGGPPLSASFIGPTRLAARGSKIFVTDGARIRAVDFAVNITTTVAGNGTYGYSGDGGPATSAELNFPFGVATDAGGDVYIADTFNYRIRAVGAASPPLIVPGAVTNLGAVATSTYSVSLSWTSPGNNGATGTLVGTYNIGFGTVPISASPAPPSSVGFNDPSVTHILIATTTAPGVPQGTNVSGLSGSTTYYFALETTNSTPGNTSPLSNVAGAQTFSVSASTDGVVSLVSNVPGITVTIISSPTAASVALLRQGLTLITAIYDLSPSGLSFNPPAQLTFTYPVGTSTSTLAIYKFNGSVWVSSTVTSQSINVAARTISGNTATSSLYAVFTRETLPPRTALNIGTPQFGAAPVFITSSTLLSFTAVDDFAVVGDSVGVGVAQTLFAVDSSTFAVFLAPFVIAAEGTHTIRFFSVDKAGNAEAVHSAAVAVDNTTPLTQLSISTPTFFSVAGSTFIAAASRITLSAVDPPSGGVASGVAVSQFRVDGGVFAAYSTPFSLTEGAHVIDFQSKDNLGNLEVLRSVAVSADYTPPATQLVIQGSQTVSGGVLFVSTSALFAFAAQDPVVTGIASGVKQTLFSADGGHFGLFVSSFTLAVGTHTLAFQSVDNVGNLEAVKTDSFTIRPSDILPPRTVLNIGQPQSGAGPTFITSATPLSLAAVDDALLAGDGAGVGIAQTFFALDNGTFAQFASSFTIPTEGLHTIRFYSVDLTGNTEAVHVSTVAVDNTPPLTQANVGAPIFFDVVGSTFITSASKISFSAADPVSAGVAVGVATIQFRVDGGAFTLFTSPFTLSEGPHVVDFQSKDRLGNLEVPRSVTLRVDDTPPASQLVIQGSQTVTSGTLFVSTNALFAFSAQDPVVNGVAAGVKQIVFSVDGGFFQVFASSFSLSIGTHTLAFQSLDNVGNLEALRTSSFTVRPLDILPPRTALNVGQPHFGTNPIFINFATLLSFSAVDDALTVGDAAGLGVAQTQYSIDGGALAVFTTSFTISGAGTHVIRFFSADVVGNVEAVRTSTVAVDNTSPVTSLAVVGGKQSPGPNSSSFSASSNTLFLLTAVDPSVNGVASGVAFTQYQDNGGAFQTFTSSFALTEGSHALAYRSQDNVGNLEVLRSTSVLVDATPPASTATIGSPSFVSVDGTIYVSTTTPITFSAADPALPQTSSGPATAGSGVSRIEVAVDTAIFAPFSAALTLAEGRHTILYRAVDNVGNVEAARTLAIQSDATAPVSSLSIGLPQATLTDGSTLVGNATPIIILSTDPVSNAVASGVKDSFFSVNGSPSTLFSGAITLSPPDGPKTISFFSRDNVLNAEVAKSTTVVLDSTPPTAVLLSPSPDDGGVCSVFNGKVNVLGTVSDAHFQGYVLDFAPGVGAVSGFALISSGTVAVSSGVLGVWNTAALSGFQTLRLTASDIVDNVTITTAAIFVGNPSLLMVLQGRHGFNKPTGVAVDVSNNIYVADANNDQVEVFTSTGGFVAVLGRGDGPSADPDDRAQGRLRLNKPKDVKVDASGNIYIADTNNNRVIKVSRSGQLLLQLGRQHGSDGRKDRDDDSDLTEMPQHDSGSGRFNKPSGLALDGQGNIYVSDTNNNRIEIFSSNGSLLTTFNLPVVAPQPQQEGLDDENASDPPDSGNLGQPFGIAVDGTGAIYVADAKGDRLLKFSQSGTLLASFGASGSGAGQFHRPEGVAVSPDGDCLYVSDRNNSRVQRFDFLGNVTLIFGTLGNLQSVGTNNGIFFNAPVGLALDGTGNLYVADRNNNAVQKFGASTVAPTAPVVVNVASIVHGLIRAHGGGSLLRGDRVEVDLPDGSINQDMDMSLAPENQLDPLAETFKAQSLQRHGLVAISSGIDCGPEGATFNKPVTLILPIDPSMLPAGADASSLAVYYWNPQVADWQAVPSVVNASSFTISAQVMHFSLYRVLGSIKVAATDPTFNLKASYVFPNPVRGVSAVTIRVQPGLADSVEVHVYDLTGRRVHASSDFRLAVLDDGNGLGAQDTYDHVWDVSGVGSGVYTYVITAKKSGQTDIHKTGKVGIVK